jgi:hypothetical protein
MEKLSRIKMDRVEGSMEGGGVLGLAAGTQAPTPIHPSTHLLIYPSTPAPVSSTV